MKSSLNFALRKTLNIFSFFFSFQENINIYHLELYWIKKKDESLPAEDKFYTLKLLGCHLSMWNDIVKVEEIQSHRDLIYVREKFSTGETQFLAELLF